MRPTFKICKAVVGQDGSPYGTFPLCVLHIRCGIGTTDKVLSPDAASTSSPPVPCFRCRSSVRSCWSGNWISALAGNLSARKKRTAFQDCAILSIDLGGRERGRGSSAGGAGG